MLKRQNLLLVVASKTEMFSHGSRGQKSKITVLSGLVSSESSLAAFLLVLEELERTVWCFFLFLREYQPYQIKAPPL